MGNRKLVGSMRDLMLVGALDRKEALGKRLE